MPFEQIHSSSSGREGTGLGLTICQKLAQLIGSQIHVSSTVGEGSIFWFDLDLEGSSSYDDFNLDLNPITKVVDSKDKAYKILLVNDISNDNFLLLKQLQTCGFEVVEALNAKQGLAMTKTFKPDLILFDVSVPEIHGIEFLEQLRKYPQFENVKVIYISADTLFINELEASQLEYEDFLPKPIDYSQLLGSLENHLQLTWIDDESSNEAKSIPLVAPSQETIADLWDLANMGNIGELRKQMEFIEQLDSRYSSFVNQVCKLVESFEIDELVNFLEPYHKDL